MTRTPRTLWTWLLLLSVALAPASLAAQEIEEAGEEDVARPTDQAPRKTLAERIPAVSGRVFAKRGRVELVPMIGLSLNDPFFDHVVVSGAVAYHVLEPLFVAVSADFFGSIASNIAVAGGGQPDRPEYVRPVYAARLEAGWSPIYGKLSLFAEGVFHFDTYISAGAGVVGPSDGSPALAGTVAVGEHFFFNEWMALRLELRDQIFKLARLTAAGTDANLQNLLSVSLGVSFFVPPTFERETL
jgi:outer membrane beta-barrel protein